MLFRSAELSGALAATQLRRVGRDDEEDDIGDHGDHRNIGIYGFCEKFPASPPTDGKPRITENRDGGIVKATLIGYCNANHLLCPLVVLGCTLLGIVTQVMLIRVNYPSLSLSELRKGLLASFSLVS